MRRWRARSQFASTFVWFFYGLVVVSLAICATWAAYSQVNYGYPFWYRALNIDNHIQEYGPKNQYKSGFERLEAEAHWQAFEAIRDAVHDGGEGLVEIRYRPPGERSQRLLHEAEIVHLRDVARFLTFGGYLAVVLALLWLPLAWLCVRLKVPPMRERLAITVFSLGAVIAWLLLAGPTAVFYQLHTWVFPAGHEWFFYWEESLMSTLMKAPVLFGGIAIVISVGALLLTPVLYWSGLRLAGNNQKKTRS